MTRPWLAHYPQGVPAEISTEGYSSLTDLLDRACKQYASRIACTAMGSDITYAQLDAHARAFAAWLQGLGLPQGKVLLRRGRPVVEILLQARGLAIDLLVLGAHHRQSPEGFAGTTLERILQSSPAPVLLAVNAEPTPWTRALVALDYSPCASRALQQAWALLGDGATLHALHIHEVEEVHASEDPAAVAFERELFDRLVSDEGSALPARPAQLSHELRHGERQSCLQAVLAERQPQLLALGAHSRGMLADVLLGSLALELLRQPPCDVLVVR